jgi:hypothetical protein
MRSLASMMQQTIAKPEEESDGDERWAHLSAEPVLSRNGGFRDFQ